jgi:hypothetical protein
VRVVKAQHLIGRLGFDVRTGLIAAGALNTPAAALELAYFPETGDPEISHIVDRVATGGVGGVFGHAHSLFPTEYASQ